MRYIRCATLPVAHSDSSAGRHIPLIIRCFAQKRGDQWQAFTLEFGLAVQASSQEEVKHKLEGMIVSYLNDALNGEDREHAEILLNRSATARAYAWYHIIKLHNWLFRGKGGPERPQHLW